MIVYAFDPLSGFVCGNTETGLTSYAYPTSVHAVAAKRKPQETAWEMLANEKASMRQGDYPAAEWVREYDARMWATLRVRGAVPADFRAEG